MKNRIHLAGLLMAAWMVVPARAFAADKLSFEDVWGRIKTQSTEIQAAGKDIDAAQVAADRAARHWYPKVMLDARLYGTNDAAQNFFSLLGERHATAADFSPALLNHPGSYFYQKASVIVDLPLYEGGQKKTISEAMRMAITASSTARDATQRYEYAQTARDYALALSHDSQRQEIARLDDRVDQLVKRYQLGSKSNPVGYAGALGLKSLQARFTGLIEQSLASRKSALASLSVRAQLDRSAWEPLDTDYQSLIDQVLGKPEELAGTDPSLRTRAMMEGARIAEKSADAQKARFLPRAGIAVQGDLTNGSRATGMSYLAGAYLQWNLLDNSNYQVREQELMQAEAMRLRAEHMAEGDRIARAQTREAISAIETNLKLIQQSLDLSDEQIKTAEQLFKNGSINALQFAEVFSRRADIILAEGELEKQWIDMRVQEYLSSGAGQGNN